MLANSKLRRGSLVKYSCPLNAQEGAFRFTVLHIEHGKADIELVCSYTVKPVETVALDDIVDATEGAP